MANTFLHILNSAVLHGAVHFTVKRIAVPRIYRKVQARCRLPGGFMKLQKRSLEIKPSFVLLCLFTAECVGKINHKKYQHGYRGGFKPCKAVFCLKAAGRKDEPRKS